MLGAPPLQKPPPQTTGYSTTILHQRGQYLLYCVPPESSPGQERGDPRFLLLQAGRIERSGVDSRPSRSGGFHRAPRLVRGVPVDPLPVELGCQPRAAVPLAVRAILHPVARELRVIEIPRRSQLLDHLRYHLIRELVAREPRPNLRRGPSRIAQIAKSDRAGRFDV